MLFIAKDEKIMEPSHQSAKYSNGSMTILNGISHIENGETADKRRLTKYRRKFCSRKILKKRLPILTWLPTYNLTILIQDTIAGVTVGLTAIPQGIAYAVVAGLSPEYGLYSGLLGGFLYAFVGTCKAVTVGPTAIMSAMVARYVFDYSADFAVLACFLSGVVALTMGIFNLGFLVEFISSPVINGFTTAAALQIASGQFKSLFGLTGQSGSNFGESIYFFIRNIKTARLWDPILGFATILVLFILKHIGKGCGRTDPLIKQIRWFLSLGRNAVVVIIGIIVAYILKVKLDSEPFVLIGDIGEGLPSFRPPPFQTTVGNETYSFRDMMRALGPQSVVIPLVAILESVAIAKAFSGGLQLDATQEMIAIGICNVLGSFVRSMPATGSFTRAALNFASGAQTPAGGIFTGFLIVLALSVMTSTFYYIPKASLAGLIITAMFSMIEFTVFVRLWANSKRELTVLVVTIAVCLYFGLEYGIVTGIIFEAAMLLYTTSRPFICVKVVQGQKNKIILVPLSEKIPYCAADHVRRTLIKASREAESDSTIVINGTNLQSMDTTVAINLISVIKDIEKNYCQVMFLNFNLMSKKMCIDINPKLESKFVSALNVLDLAEVSLKTD